MAKETNKEKVLAALLSTSSIAAAAKKSGVSESTVYRLLDDDEFKKEYRTARRAAVENSIAQVQAATGEAVETLTRNLNCGNPSVEVRAAQILIENAIKGVDLDLVERIEAIEEMTKEKENELKKQT